MAAYDFKLGTSVGGLRTLDSLSITNPKPYFHPFTQEINLANSTVMGHGWPMAEWVWGYLADQDRAALRVFCPGASASVFIRTTNDALTYKNYSAVMIWPTPPEDRQAGRVVGFTLKLVKLVEV
jgi:hypothetical protein